MVDYPYKPATIQDIIDNNGGTVEIDRYQSLTDRLFRKKIKGRIDIADAYKSPEYAQKQNSLFWAVEVRDGTYVFNTIREGHTFEEVLGERVVLETDAGEIQRLRNLWEQKNISLDDILIVELAPQD